MWADTICKLTPFCMKASRSDKEVTWFSLGLKKKALQVIILWDDV